jgi:ubiquinone/menaquinone biosynthesis C-methylase UbiE
MKKNPFEDPVVVGTYESWYLTTGHWVDRREKALLKQLLALFPGAKTILEVGCGTGHFVRWFGVLRLKAVGLDLSRPMLDEAVSLNTWDYLQGDALSLPFISTSFDLVSFITTLEFLPDPFKALTEALRITRKGLILGVLNSGSRLGRQYKGEGGIIWEASHFFTPIELKRMILEITGEDTKIFWRTTLWPYWPGALPLPWGGFIGMAVKL